MNPFGWVKNKAEREPVAGTSLVSLAIANIIVQIVKAYAPELELSPTEMATVVAAVFTALETLATIYQRSKVTPVAAPNIYPRSLD